MINLTLVSTVALKNTSEKPVHIQEVRVIPANMINSESDKDFFLSKIQVKLDIFAAQLGYPHEILATDVRNAIRQSANAFFIMRSWRRRMQGANFRDQYGYNVGLALGQTATETQYLDSINLAEVTPSTGAYLSVPNVSNSLWSDYVGQLSEVAVIPKAYADYFDYLASNVFTNSLNTDDGVSQVFVNNYGPTLNHEPLAAIQATRALLNKNPLIRTFLATHMDIDSEVVMNSFDWMRDLSKTTVNFVDDRLFVEALETTANVSGWRVAGAGTPLSQFEFFYAPEGVYYDPLTSVSTINFSATENIHKMFFAAKDDLESPVDRAVTADIRVRIPQMGTSVLTDHCFPNAIVDKLESFSGITVSEMANVMKNITKFQDNYLLDEPIERYLTLKRNGTNDIKVSLSDELTTSRVKPGYNLFATDEETYFEIIRDIKLGMLFGGTYVLAMPVNNRVPIGVDIKTPTTLVKENKSKPRNNNRRKPNKNKNKNQGK